MSNPVSGAVHLVVRPSGGGTETNVRLLCRHVPEFRMLSLEEVGAYPPLPGRLGALRRELLRDDPAVVFCYGAAAHLAAWAVVPRRIPLVGSIRCESDFAGWKGVLRRLIAGRFSGWVSNARATLGGLPGMVVYNGVPVPPEDEKPLLSGLRRPVMGILAREHPKKGHRFALDLWQSLGRPGTLVFAGRLGDDLRREAESAGVLCTGHVEPGPLLRSLDLLLIPSTAEGMPTVMLEAMARGVPCLATPVGGIGEVIRHGVNGYLLPAGEWRRLLSTMDWTSIGGVGGAARQDVLREYTVGRMVEGFREAARRWARSAAR